MVGGLLAKRRVEGRHALPPRGQPILLLGCPAARLHAARRQAVDVVLVALVVHGGGEVLLAEALAFTLEHGAPLILDVAVPLGDVADLSAALRLVLGHLIGVLARHAVGLGRASRREGGRRERHHREQNRDLHLTPASAASIAFSASGALAASGPPPCAMSGQPPPPLPPSASTPAFTRSTALRLLERSSVTPTTAEALPSSMPISATTPEPSFFLNSSAMPLRSLATTPFSTRPISFTPPTSRTSSAADAPEPPPPASASALRASLNSRSILRWPSTRAANRAGRSSGRTFSVADASARRSAWRRTCSSAAAPANASMRRTPAATAPSPTILNRPISPVRSAWVPPHSSTEYFLPSPPPIDSTRTSSPYFSPNSAMAPAAIASSGVISRVSTGLFSRIRSLTSSSILRSSSSEIGLVWLMSKRSRSGATSEPFWVTCSPRWRRSASCSRCVAEWWARSWARRIGSMVMTTSSPSWPPDSA